MTELDVLKSAEDGFSFHWTKEGSRRQIKTTDDRPNTVSFPSVREEDFGHYQCEVKEAGKVVLNVCRALYNVENGKVIVTVISFNRIPVQIFVLIIKPVSENCIAGRSVVVVSRHPKSL